MTDEKIRRCYRLCPCFSYDIEGIQSWLEDLAAEGLVLEPDGLFFGIFTFRKSHPEKLRYRLSPIQEKSGIFSDMGDEPEEEEKEYSRACGWEYLGRYGSFCIYRATDPNALPLHTDPAVHAMALGALKKQQRSVLIHKALMFLLFGLLYRNIFSFFRSGAIIGLLFLCSVILWSLWLIGSAAAATIRLSRYQKRLRQADTLDRPKQWRNQRISVRILKMLPWVLVLTIGISWLSALEKAQNRAPLEAMGTVPFAVLGDVFPGVSTIQDTSMGDYNTGVRFSTALSENYEWNELASVKLDGASHHCILRLSHHITVSEFWAKGLADDYYLSEKLRYHGKRFADLDAPETQLDDVRVFSSYGILHILIRHENTVTHATVSITQQGQNNQWMLWLKAMEAKLLG